MSQPQDPLDTNRLGDQPSTTAVPVPLSISSIKRLLTISITGLVIAHILFAGLVKITGHQSIGGWVNFFNLDAEANLPTYFSSLLLLFAALILALIGFDAKDSNPSNAKKWLTLSALFCLMSIDEAAQVHEKFGYIANFSTTLNEALGSRSWIFGGLILVFLPLHISGSS